MELFDGLFQGQDLSEKEMTKDQGGESGDGGQIGDAGLELVIAVKCCGGKNFYGVSFQLTDGDVPGIQFPVARSVTDGIEYFREFEEGAGWFLFLVVSKVGFDQGADSLDAFGVFLYGSGKQETLVAKFVAMGFL